MFHKSKLNYNEKEEKFLFSKKIFLSQNYYFVRKKIYFYKKYERRRRKNRSLMSGMIIYIYIKHKFTIGNGTKVLIVFILRYITFKKRTYRIMEA